MKRFILSIAVMAAMLFGSLALPSTADARPWGYRGGYGYYGPRAYYGYGGYGYRPYYGGYYGGYGYRPYYGGYYAPRYYSGYPYYYGTPGYYSGGYGYYPGLRAGVYVY